MATIANAYEGFSAKGLREDLTDQIVMISPTQTPFLSEICSKESASATFHEWQTDVLAAAADNAFIEGEDVTIQAPAYTKRVGNQLQISSKAIITTGTLEAVSKAGRDQEMAMQLAKKAKELKRDMETGLTQNGARAVGSTAAPRHSAGLENWFQTNGIVGANDLIGATGAHCANTGGTPNPGATRTDGTQRALNEAQLRIAVKYAWDQGGEPGIIMCGGAQKQSLSALSGAVGAGRPMTQGAESRRWTQAVDVYESDFGVHRVIPNRFQRNRSLFVLTEDLWAVAYLRGFSQWPIAKTGDSEKRQLLCEYTLVAKNEAGSSIVADLN